MTEKSKAGGGRGEDREGSTTRTEPPEGKLMPDSYDPYHDKKVYHWAHLIDPDGHISPWCAKVPRRLNLRRELWTMVEAGVTCKKCLVARKAAL